MKTLIVRLGEVALVLLLATGTMTAQFGKIRGMVRDGLTGDPLGGTMVTVREDSAGTTTNSSGVYEISGLPSGYYTLDATMAGYAMTTRRRVYVNPSWNTPRDFPMYPAPPFIVTSVDNSGPGSLNNAISSADSLGGGYIMFDLPDSIWTIRPSSPVTTITRTVFIDGSTQPESGYVELDGTIAGPLSSGLTINAYSCRIKGLVINRFKGNGIQLNGGMYHVIEGNLIGTDPTGTVALGNLASGINLYSDSTTVGGPTPSSRNVISGGTLGVGIAVRGRGNTIQGNYIGTNRAGTAPLGNDIGIFVQFPYNLIGGSVPGARNIVSGNRHTGIFFDANLFTGTKVQGNFIGVDVTGRSKLGNGEYGVALFRAGGVTIGGTTPGERNIISGNGLAGIVMRYDSSDANIVTGNFIGTDISGTVAIGNGAEGIRIDNGARGNRIGGTTAGEGNIISGNLGTGISVVNAPTTGTTILRNLIGTDAGGLAPLGNAGDGISIGDTVGPYWTLTEIGGLDTTWGNIIAHNGSNGVTVTGGIGTLIMSNRIFANGRLGIDLGATDTPLQGVTLNDPLDADFGPNLLQNFPAIEYAPPTTGVVRGTLSSTPNAQFIIQLFVSGASDPSGYGEGERFLGSTIALTDAGGHATFSAAGLPMLNAGQVITATATDSMRNTSEFSEAYIVTAPGTLKVGAGFVAEQYATGLLEPEGMALDLYGRPFVAVRGSQQVVRLDSGGTKRVIAVNFKAPVDVAVDRNNILYVADIDASCIYAIDLNTATFPVDARFLTPRISLFAKPAALEIGSNDWLYISLTGGESGANVVRVDLTSAPVPAYVVKFTSADASEPRGIAFATNGDMYVALGVQGEVRLMSAGTSQPVDGSQLPIVLQGLSQPAGIDLSIDGRVYVATRASVVSSRPNSQTWSTFLTGLSGGSSNDVVCGNDGYFYVSDAAGGRIIRITAPRQQKITGQTLTYVISQDGEPLVTDGSDITAIRNGFKHWQDVPTTSLVFAGGALTTQKIAVSGDGVNLVTFQDDEFPFPPYVLAVTAKTLEIGPYGYDATIVDADILFNPAYSNTTAYSFGTDTKHGYYDIESIVTHESGHTVGLVHSGVPTATMFFVLQPGTGARTLAHDDRAWISYLYPGATFNSTYGSIGGTVNDGYNPGTGVAGALVLASSTTTIDSVHAYTDRYGSYLIPGLAPGNYRVYIHPLNGDVFGYPLTADYVSAYLQTLTSITDFPAEYYNGTNESADPGVDNPSEATALTVAAGGLVGPIALVTNLDKTAPTVVSVFPGAGSTNADVTTEILVAFSEPVSRKTVSNSTVTVKSVGGTVQGSFLFLNDDTLVVFTPATPLAYATAYTVQILQGITDRHGNALAAPVTSPFTTRAPDAVPPTVEQIVPANNTANVFLTNAVTVVFSESVQPASLSNASAPGFVMTGPLGAPVTGTFTFEQGSKVAIFTPKTSLAENASYTLRLSTAIKDLAGNPLANPSTSTFATVPHAAPQVKDYGPSSNEKAVAVTTPVFVDFSEPINMATVNSSTFQLFGPSGQVNGSFDSLQNWARVVFRPSNALEFNTKYTISLTTAVQDLSTPPENLVSPWSSSFSTATKPMTPAIFNIYPSAAIVGTDVTINGQGFDPDPLKNTVMFDTVKAVVKDATLNSLLAAVPEGAPSGPVTVNVGGAVSAPFQFTVLQEQTNPANQVVATVKASSGTRSGDVTPDGALAYVTNEAANTVTVIDLTTYAVVGTPIPVGSAPMKIAINPDGTYAYVTNYNSNSVSVIDIEPGSPTYNTVVKTIPVGINPIGVFVTPDGSRVYVAELTSKSISIIDGDPSSGAFNYVVAKVNTSSGNRDGAVNPDGTLAFFTGTEGVTVLDLSPSSGTYNQVLAKVNPSTGTRNVTINPDGTLAVVTTMDGVIWIIDINLNGPSFGNVVAKVSTSSGSRNVTISPDGTLLYVTNYDNSTVSVYQFVSTVGPGDPGYNPVVSTSIGLKPVATIPVGTNPEGLFFDPKAKVLVVTNAGSANVTIVNIQGQQGDYVLLASNSVKLEGMAAIRSGNIVVNNNGPGIELVPGFELSVGPLSTIAAGYTVEANRIQVMKQATVGSAVQYNQLVNRGVITGALTPVLPLPVYDSLPKFTTGPVGTTDVTVLIAKTKTLAPGKYRDITVMAGGKLVLQGGVYNVRNVSLGLSGNISYKARSEVRVQQRLVTCLGARIAPSPDLPKGSTIGASSMMFYVGGINGKTGKPDEQPSAVDIGGNNSIQANFYAGNGTIRFGPLVQATGSFIARDVLVGLGGVLNFDSYLKKFGSSLPKMETGEFAEDEIPAEFDLAQNYPNPFNPSTTIQFDISKSMTAGVRVRITIYNIIGQTVKEIVNEEMTPGRYAVVWDGTNGNGQIVASGVYLCRITAGNFAKTTKMMMLK